MKSMFTFQLPDKKTKPVVQTESDCGKSHCNTLMHVQHKHMQTFWKLGSTSWHSILETGTQPGNPALLWLPGSREDEKDSLRHLSLLDPPLPPGGDTGRGDYGGWVMGVSVRVSDGMGGIHVRFMLPRKKLKKHMRATICVNLHSWCQECRFCQLQPSVEGNKSLKAALPHAMSLQSAYK